MPNTPYNVNSWDDIANQTELEANQVMKAIYYAQMQHETGNGQSELFVECNNLFGMRPSQKREQFWQYIKEYNTPSGISAYAGYQSPNLSLQDVLARNEVFNITPVEHPEDALVFMNEVWKSGYFTDNPKVYFKAWLAHLREGYPDMKWPADTEIDDYTKNENGFSIAGVSITVILLAVAGYFAYKKYLK